jgi:trk system potassium uptake protein
VRVETAPHTTLRLGRDAASVAHDLGAVLYVPGAMAGLSVPVAVMAGDTHVVVPLAGTAVVCAMLGAALLFRFRHVRAEHRWPAVEVVAIGWLLSGLVTALVFWFLGRGAPVMAADQAFLDPMNALFEGLSGITSTGLTMVGGQESELTATAQWWRSLSQWVGGVGMVLFALGFTSSATGMRTLYEAEGRHPDLPGGTSGTVRGTMGLYLGLTVAAVLALAATEHDAWTALNHGITGMSTGGFSITGDSIAGFGTATKLVTLVIMVTGSVAFVAHHLLLVQRRPGRLRHLTPIRGQIVVLVGGAAVLVGVNTLSGSGVPVVDTLFQWASAAGTAGFSTEPDLQGWAGPALMLLVVAMFVGAPSGSTGGGWKLDRLLWLSKALIRRFRGTEAITWDGGAVRRDRAEELVRHAAMLGALWLLTVLVGSASLSAIVDAPVRDVLFEVTSAVSNVGLSTGVVDADLGGGAKAVFVALMYLGRLELFLALALATQSEHA